MKSAVVTGVILHVTPFKENSEILQVLTKEEGLIGLLCRGSKNIKSKFLNKTRLYNYASFQIKFKSEGLSLVTEIKVINYYSYLHSSIILISYLVYIGSLSYQVAKQEQKREVLEILLSTLEKMNRGLDPLVLCNILELKYLKYLGINLNLEACVKCGKKTSIKTLNGEIGGLICDECYQNEYIVSKRTIYLIRYYATLDIDSLKEIRVSEVTKKEINLFLSNYYQNYTGLYLKLKNNLNKLIM